VKKFHQIILIASTILCSWFAMQAIHELCHILGALATKGKVSQVVIHPLTISRTDLSANPHPLFVAWAGPVFGVLAPLILWAIFAQLNSRFVFVLRFFAAFCLVANGLYIGLGSFAEVGDCREMLKHGSEKWQLWLFGILTTPVGFWLWHGQGDHFGFGSVPREIDHKVAYGMLAACLGLIGLGLLIGGR
jgi:hypothetical protein